jgi:hypothetical protein
VSGKPGEAHLAYQPVLAIEDLNLIRSTDPAALMAHVLLLNLRRRPGPWLHLCCTGPRTLVPDAGDPSRG